MFERYKHVKNLHIAAAAAIFVSPSCVAGRKRSRHESTVEAFHTNIPLFHPKKPDSTYALARGRSGFSMNRCTRNARFTASPMPVFIP